MKKQVFAAACCSLITLTTMAQNKTSIGIEFGISNDKYQIIESHGPKEPGQENQLKKFPLLSATRSLLVRQELGKTFFVEAGIMDKRYRDGIGFRFEQGYSSSGTFRSLMVPVRFGANINIIGDKLRLTPLMGLTFSRNFLPPWTGTAYGQGSISNGTASPTVYTYSYSTFTPEKTHTLLQAGLGLDLKLGRSLLLSANASYYHGFKTVITQDIRYSVNNKPTQSAQAFSTGDMFQAGIGLKYSFGNLFGRN